MERTKSEPYNLSTENIKRKKNFNYEILYVECSIIIIILTMTVWTINSYGIYNIIDYFIVS